MSRLGIYPGSFDPITRGHEDLIRRSLAFVDRVIVAVAVNVAKQPLFTAEERLALIRETVDDKRVDVRTFDGLLVPRAPPSSSAGCGRSATSSTSSRWL
jgi:pantetheine-phosphate adenylyltransferase